MPFFRSPLATVLAGIMFAGTGAVLSAATAIKSKRGSEPDALRVQPPPR